MPNDTMQPPQDPSLGMTEDEHAAALGYISTLARHVMGHQQTDKEVQDGSMPTDATQTPQDATQPTSSVASAPDLTPRLDALESQFTTFKDEVQKAIKDEVGTVRDMIKEALSSEPSSDATDNQNGQN